MSCRSGLYILSAGCLCALFLTLVACQAPLLHIRQDNAQRVLVAYRAKPVAAANQGRTDLTLHDCRRLVLSNSLDMHTALWDEQVKARTAQSTLPAMLPKIEGRYEYSQRDTLAWSRSDVIGQEGSFEVIGPGPGTGVTNWSTARTRAWSRGHIELKWSPMEAAMAYYFSRVRNNETDFAKYQRDRVAQKLIGSATAAFYRLLALQEALPRAEELVNKLVGVSSDLETVGDRGRTLDLYREKEKEYQETLRYSKARWSNAKARLSEIRVSIGKQRDLLAANMNVCPDDHFRVIGRLEPIPPWDLEPCKLEAAALLNRPEAFQADLTFLSSLDEQKRSIVKFFPKAEGFLGQYWDATKFLYHNGWTDGGLRVTWDLMQFTSDLLSYQAAKENVVKTDKERSLISMGILTQVRMETLDAISAYDRLKKAAELEVQARESYRIAQALDKGRSLVDSVSRHLGHVDARLKLCDLLEARIDKLLAAGELHAALADLHAAVGTNFPVSTAHPQAQDERRMAHQIMHLPKSVLGSAVGAVSDLIRR
ncbi:MAG: hypothetical protein RDU20_04375 [Desulfomonilaceae bacterium]|nr:hypothetical protein [Desulfomonilaceae bacterium]